MYIERQPQPVFGEYKVEPAMPLLAGLGEYRVEPAQPLFAGFGAYRVEPAQPLFAGLDPYDYPSLQGQSAGLGQLGAGEAVTLGIGGLLVAAVVSFGVAVGAAYVGARFAGCRRQAA